MEFCTVIQVKELFARHASGFEGKKSPLFLNGNACLPKFVKRGIVRDIEVDESSSSGGVGSAGSSANTFTCNVPGCLRTFENCQSYESHYGSLHRYGCSICHKNLPSGHLLDLHIQESHDSFFAVQAERKPMYACYVEECQHKSVNPTERRDHCIRHHKFPHDFRFDVPPKTNGDNNKMDTDDVKPVLRNFHFGHNTSKAFARPKKSILDSDTLMEDLKESLPQSL